MSNCRNKRGRWEVLIATRGGNHSWNGVTKYFDPSRCDLLFVHVGDGRRWLIPSHSLECRSGLTLGGPKYSEFEVEPGRPLIDQTAGLQSNRPGEFRSGQTGRPVKALAQPSQVRILPPPSTATRPSNRAIASPKAPRIGRTRIWGKGRVTIPARLREAAGLQVGDGLYVEARDDGNVCW